MTRVGFERQACLGEGSARTMAHTSPSARRLPPPASQVPRPRAASMRTSPLRREGPVLGHGLGHPFRHHPALSHGVLRSSRAATACLSLNGMVGAPSDINFFLRSDWTLISGRGEGSLLAPPAGTPCGPRTSGRPGRAPRAARGGVLAPACPRRGWSGACAARGTPAPVPRGIRGLPPRWAPP